MNRRRTTRSAQARVVRLVGGAGIPTLSLLLATLCLPPLAAADQVLDWDAQGAQFKTFDLRERIVISHVEFNFVSNCAPGGTNDTIPPDDGSNWTMRIHIVPFNVNDPFNTIHVGDPLNGPALLISAGAASDVDIGATVPAGSVAPGTYAIVYDECDNGRYDPEDYILAPAFRVLAPWETFGRDATHQSRSPLKGPGQGQIAWWVAKDGSPGTPSCCSNSSPAVAGDGTVYVGSNGSRLFALYPQNGGQRWAFVTNDWIDANPTLGPDGTIYVGSRSGTFYAIRPDGSQRWSRTLDGGIRAGAVIDSENHLIYVAAFSGTLENVSLYQLVMETGQELWHVTFPGGLWRPPTLGPDGTLYVSDLSGGVRAMNRDGSLRWRTVLWQSGTENTTTCPGTAVTPVGVSSPVWTADGGGQLYVGASYFCSGDASRNHGHLIALRASDGAVLWEYPADHETGTQFWSGPAVGANGRLYVGGGLRAGLGAPVSWYLLGVAPSGGLVEQYPLPAAVAFWSGPVIGADGTIYVGTESGSVHALRDGAERWSLQAGSDIETRPAIGLGGALYVPSYDGQLYAIGSAEQVTVRALEVNQAVQTWRNDVPLVAGKTTHVRAHLEYSGAAPATVKGCLRGFGSGGVEFPESPLEPANVGGAVLYDPQSVLADDRGALEKGLYFRLPPNWTSGNVSLHFERQLPERSCAQLVSDPLPPADRPALSCTDPAEPGGSPDDCSVAASFTPTAPLEIRFVNVIWRDASGTHSVPLGEIFRLAGEAVAAFPVAGLPIALQGGAKLWDGELHFNRQPTQDEVLATLGEYRADQGCGAGCRTLYLGVVPDTNYGGVANHVPSDGTAAEIDQAGHASVSLYDHTDPLRLAHVHELGHLLGRDHTSSSTLDLDRNGVPDVQEGKPRGGPCLESSVVPSSPDFPYIFDINGHFVSALGPQDGPDDGLVFGLDTTVDASLATAAPRVVDSIAPGAGFGHVRAYADLMSYCAGAGGTTDYDWFSDVNYRAVRDGINERGAGGAAAAVRAAATASPSLLIRGQVNLATDVATLLPFGRTTTEAPTAPAPGPYALELRSAADALLSTIPMALGTPVVDPPGTASGTANFLVAIPDDGTVGRVVLRHGAAILASRTASAHPPSVHVNFPNGGEMLSAASVDIVWSAADADGDPLTYTVQYSADGGASWETLAVDWPDQTLTVSTDFLAATGTGRIRVQAQDGFRIVADDSDANFSVPNHAPLVEILSPESNRLFAGEQLIQLQALAFDREEGALPGARYAWRSGLAGPLGTGSALTVAASNLPEGLQTLTVAVTDSAGAVAEASVPVRVARSVADLAVTSSDSPDPVAPGANVSYTLAFGNRGPATATAVTVTDQIPAGLTFVSLSGSVNASCSIGGGNIACGIGSLAAGRSESLTFTYRTAGTGTVVNHGSVSGNETDPVPADNSADQTTVVRVPDTDGDGVPDNVDNCIQVANPDQLDSDGDGYGNRCDGDLNNDGAVNFADLALFRTAFGTVNANADLNGSGGVVNFADLAIFRSLFGHPPGPSALRP